MPWSGTCGNCSKSGTRRVTRRSTRLPDPGRPAPTRRTSGVRPQRLLEDDGSVAVHEDAVFEVQPDGACEDAPLDLAPEADEVLDRVAVGDVGDVLVDYGAGVQLLADVVGRGPDGLDAPLVRPPVGVGPGEGRQERVVDVYKPV